MKTWTFTTEIFWMFLGMCLCPQSQEQTDPGEHDEQAIENQTASTDSSVHKWYSPNYIRPPPLLI
ncbi:MAG: hypothetical protein A2Y77_01065 [Planctomycetes bacterium RBG_13_62_9]|nr:MAG: hypothetical protein A2Y77_01065 [Planctomycetes bacterium RBG_13_62_9]